MRDSVCDDERDSLRRECVHARAQERMHVRAGNTTSVRARIGSGCISKEKRTSLACPGSSTQNKIFPRMKRGNIANID